MFRSNARSASTYRTTVREFDATSNALSVDVLDADSAEDLAAVIDDVVPPSEAKKSALMAIQSLRSADEFPMLVQRLCIKLCSIS
jgi:hypothetical protein